MDSQAPRHARAPASIALALLLLAFACSPVAASDAPATSTSGDSLTSAEKDARPPVRDAGSGVAPSPPANDLAATIAVPWNPPKAVSGADAWETIVRLPGRVVSLPLSLAGAMSRHSLLWVEEKSVVPRVMFLFAVFPRYGIQIGPASLGERTGFGGRFAFAPPAAQGWLELEASGSLSSYSRERVRVGRDAVHLEYQHDWRPEDRFYGLGLRSAEDDTSNYVYETNRLTLSGTLAEGRSDWPVVVDGWAGWRRLVMRGGRDDDETPVEVAFPSIAGPKLGVQDDHVVFGARATLDRRSGRPHWSRGFRVSASAERYEPIREPAEEQLPNTPANRAKQGARFGRYVYEAEGGVSFWRDPRTVRLAVKVVDNEASGASGTFQIPDYAKLGGAEGLSGYEPQRFHDLDALVARLSYIFPIQQHFEVDLHAEAGGVYQDVQNDLTLGSMKHSFGVALRPRTKFAPIAAIGADWSKETVRVRFSFGGVE